MNKIDEVWKRHSKATLRDADETAKDYTSTRRFDYQVTIPSHTDFKTAIEQAYKTMKAVDTCDRLDVRDNGLVICHMRRDNTNRGKIEIKFTRAANGNEVEEGFTKCTELENKTGQS